MESNKKITNHFFKNQIHFLKENFVIDNEQLFQQFSIAVERYCYFSFEMDKLIDGDYNFSEQFKSSDDKVYQIVNNHQKALRILLNIFPDNHRFWDDLDETSQRYYHILTKEKYNNNERKIFTIKDFEEYAISKHCLAYIPIKGLSYLFETKVDLQKMENIFTEIFLGMQMNDDIEDFNSDLLSGQWTYVHSLVQEFMTKNNINDNSELDKFRERVFYVSGIGEEFTRYSKERFISAKVLSQDSGFTELKVWLDNTISIIDQNEKIILNLTSN
ncbi:hypothetical protein LNP04_14060 [Chryseobacterium sp. C-71]|uniref:hypothetical protein n=1 Tax=Chryseobacterium sp. C-71 TaxID=2893882 RepID=UPI001E465DEC|nr:hypothetical protein [Chryseobacterium sp. C-71]UFH31092.1 hypothetical protein LNP04_14060 [Chryseobacterium sp. C-71]